MKIELSTGHAADLLVADTNANWTYQGARALVEYLEDIEHSNGESMDLDIVALRCDYSQYKSLNEWALDYGTEATTEMAEHDDAIEIREYIQDHGTLIEFDGGIIVSSF
jgi:hypothetical protein